MMGGAPTNIIVSVDWARVNGMNVKVACVTSAGIRGDIPTIEEPERYIREDIHEQVKAQRDALAGAFDRLANQMDNEWSYRAGDTVRAKKRVALAKLRKNDE